MEKIEGIPIAVKGNNLNKAGNNSLGEGSYDSDNIEISIINNQRHDLINKSLRLMWIWFVVIVFIWVFDVAYNLFWHFNPKFKGWGKFTGNTVWNAWIFLFMRVISLFLPFFPIVYTFLGWKLIANLLWPWCFKRKDFGDDETSLYEDM